MCALVTLVWLTLALCKKKLFLLKNIYFSHEFSTILRLLKILTGAVNDNNPATMDIKVIDEVHHNIVKN